MNAKARTAQQIIKARRTATRNARRSHTLGSHALHAGLEANVASGIGGALRAKAKQIHMNGHRALVSRTIKGQVAKRRPKLTAFRYTKAELQVIATAYNPRAAKYVAGRAALLAYAAS